MFPPGFEPGTFRVLGERDDHYTTETPGNTFGSMAVSLFFLLRKLAWFEDLAASRG